ncbi:outer membrane protein assembly factor BamA [Salinarimonas ramus]|uniref:Outer membrane protein assembly factor BamA n=1 Tax=Salinarimonas ramus TaxID=690164 RepID=A0A917Q5K7_9HYPH|nr:outer membrane protein assembly factor BamA [Salinarimonas ramus]GGK26428.1 outer membrane protein assembly factor BamA [Salinarimonas ramus]
MSMTVERRRRAAKRTSVALAALMATFTVSEALAQQVVVRGNSRIDDETIRAYVTGVSAEEARRNLVATGFFSDVRVSRQGGQLVVNVVENNVVNRVAFEGNRRLQSEALIPELQTRARQPYNPATVAADVERIQEIYRRTGRALATVSSRIVDLPDGRIDVVFTVDEGSKTGIRQISFTGNEAFSDGRLRDVMTSTESNFLSFLKTTDVYDPDRLAADLELIRRYYLRKGYADFRVVGTDVRFDEQREGYVIDIAVEEGQLYRVGNVDIDSRIADVPTEELRRRVLTREGQVYDATAVERTLVDLTTEVARRGYAFAQVRPAGERDPAAGVVNITYIVEEGPRVYIERINIRGNTRTRDYVIRRELDLGEGDPYNKVLIDRAERRLNNLGFFERVRISNEPSLSPDRVILNIDVEDRPTGSFSIAGGYSTADGFIGEVSLSEANFLGRGQAVRIAGSWGERTSGFDFSFTEPYFLGYRLSAGVDVFSRFSEASNTGRYDSRTTGGTLRFGVPITEQFSVTARYSLYQQDLDIPVIFRDNNPANGEASLALKEAEGETLTSLVGLTFTFNSLDNVRNPREGLYAELRPEIAGLGGDSEFFRITADARYYHEIFEDVVGIARVQAGHIAALGSEDLRILDHFFLGPSLVRGFRPSGIGPRDVSSADVANALGGTTYFGGSLEVQFPLPLVPRDFGFRGAVFADAGSLIDYEGRRVFSGGQTIVVDDNDEIRSSIGASLLWASPLGPLRFDYAYVLSQADGDRTQAFRFSGGTSF